METVKCPICDNPGIPDYHSQNVVCPHCGSNLAIYNTLHKLTTSSSLKKENTGGKAKRITTAAIVALCLVALASYVSYTVSRKPLETQIEEQNKEIKSLKAAIDLAQNEAHENFQKKADTVYVNESQFKYVVQKGDCSSKIVRKLFGNTEDREIISKKIAEDNGIWDSTNKKWKIIHPGQKLTINNSK